MPGLVVEVLVSESQEVKIGDELLILEAMKMQNKLRASRDGTIKNTHIQVGEQVDTGAALLEFVK